MLPADDIEDRDFRDTVMLEDDALDALDDLGDYDGENTEVLSEKYRRAFEDDF